MGAATRLHYVSVISPLNTIPPCRLSRTLIYLYIYLRSYWVALAPVTCA